MKVRHFKEETKIHVETLDDLWYLKGVLERGDEISGVSYRRLKDETKTRADKGERIRVFLGIRLEEWSFHEHSQSLRLTGPLIHSQDPNVPLGSYHTLEVGVGDTVTVKKKWRKWQLERLKEAGEASKTGLVLIVSVEEGEADFAILRSFGVDYAFRITQTIGGKEMEEGYTASARDFYRAVSEKIEEMRKKEGLAAVILCGPGFAREKVLENLKSRGDPGGIYSEPAGCGGRAGIQEVLKRGVVERIVEESKVAAETRLVEELFTRISKQGAAAYGQKEVEYAADLGAVETLLVTYTFLQKHHPDSLMEKVKGQRGEIHVVSPEHDAGERLDSIGGIAALLRFPIS
ncbi:MAG: mRNA surveillance protein pelota [Methanobacteriota archaeon]|nr:MAG: mRNA surveillance protein pelota [Euryarchaeota archaeon]